MVADSPNIAWGVHSMEQREELVEAGSVTKFGVAPDGSKVALGDFLPIDRVRSGRQVAASKRQGWARFFLPKAPETRPNEAPLREHSSVKEVPFAAVAHGKTAIELSLAPSKTPNTHTPTHPASSPAPTPGEPPHAETRLHCRPRRRRGEHRL